MAGCSRAIGADEASTLRALEASSAEAFVVENGHIFGDGVNIAARLEALAEPNGICVSARVQVDAAGKLDIALGDLYEQTAKGSVRCRSPIGRRSRSCPFR
jgi:hypothetical protein